MRYGENPNAFEWAAKTTTQLASNDVEVAPVYATSTPPNFAR
jgi:hypothetical protein